jgi:hypothetical protein
VARQHRRGPTCKSPGPQTIFTPATTPGVQSPVVDKLIAQILQWQGNKQKLLRSGGRWTGC